MEHPLSPRSGGPLRVAVGGADGGKVDQHFGQAEAFLIYDVGADGAALVESRHIDGLATAGEDRRAAIVRILADCRMLLVAKVGETPKAMLAAAGIEASDRFAGRPVAEALAAVAQP